MSKFAILVSFLTVVVAVATVSVNAEPLPGGALEHHSTAHNIGTKRNP